MTWVVQLLVVCYLKCKSSYTVINENPYKLILLIFNLFLDSTRWQTEFITKWTSGFPMSSQKRFNVIQQQHHSQPDLLSYYLRKPIYPAQCHMLPHYKEFWQAYACVLENICKFVFHIFIENKFNILNGFWKELLCNLIEISCYNILHSSPPPKHPIKPD
jgi:hypothetical protein